MPLTPNAPDYIGAVRAAIEGLRENYLKKEQLRIQEEDNQARIGLQYAQLNAQNQNAARQADIEMERLQASTAAQLAEAGQHRNSMERQAEQANLEERKFIFTQQKEKDDLALQQRKNDLDQTANALEARYFAAAQKNDKVEMAKVLDDIGKSQITSAQRLQIHQNVNLSLATTRDLTQREIDETTMQQARDLSTELNNLRPQDYTPDQYSKKIDDISTQFYGLNNKNPNVLSIFGKVQADAVGRGNKYLEGEVGREVQSFVDIAEQGRQNPNIPSRLDARWQKAYNDLYSSPDGVTNSGVKGIVYAKNRGESERQLAEWRQFAAYQGQLLAQQNPAAVSSVQTDLVTGERYRTFVYPPPNLLPVEGYNGTIDPITGRITKVAQDSWNKWLDEVRSPAMVGMNIGPMRGYQQEVAANTPAKLPVTEEEKEAQKLPFVANPSWVSLPQRSAGATALIPAAPSAGAENLPSTAKTAKSSAPPIKPETLEAIRALRARGYKGDYPPGSGRSFEETVAKLKASGYDVEPNSPTSNVAGDLIR